MTKKQFIALADAVREHNAIAKGTASFECFSPEHLVTLANALKRENPRFDPHMWLAYIAGEIGPSGGELRSHNNEVQP